MDKDITAGGHWAGLPVIATVARLLCRELTLQNEYLLAENKILKSKIKGRITNTARIKDLKIGCPHSHTASPHILIRGRAPIKMLPSNVRSSSADC